MLRKLTAPLRKYVSGIKDPNIFVVYGAILLLGLAYGLFLAVIALYLDDIGYSKTDIGSIAAWFAGGLVAFSLPMGTLIQRYSMKRALVVALFGYAVTAALLPLLAHNYWSLAVLRFMDGAFSIAIWVSCETILLHRAEARQKAFVMTLYAIAMAVGYIIGPLIATGLTLIIPKAAVFLVASAVAVCAGTYTLLKLEPDEPGVDPHADGDSPTPAATPSGTLLWRIKTSCLATFSYGYFQASVVLFLPLFLTETYKIPEEQVLPIFAFFALGMFIFSSIAGRLGDRFGHLLVMRNLALVGTPVIISVAYTSNIVVLSLITFVAGAALASISPVSLALQGVIVDKQDYARANAIYNAFYAVGIFLGPPVTSYIFENIGGITMIWHFGGLWAFFVLFTLVFHRDDPRLTHSTPAQAA